MIQKRGIAVGVVSLSKLPHYADFVLSLNQKQNYGKNMKKKKTDYDYHIGSIGGELNYVKKIGINKQNTMNNNYIYDPKEGVLLLLYHYQN